ncbi:PAS domain S-box protein, partial [bacterium]|nr:PAS domain S-box protein [bacterium]
RLIEAAAIHNFDDTRLHPLEYPDAETATINQFIAAYERNNGFGFTGEFVLAKVEENSINFLFHNRDDELDTQTSIPLYSDFAEPMRRALMGESGVTKALDYRGVEVLAAYEPVAVLNMGFVAKMDLNEVNAPLLRAILISSLVSILIIFVGAVLVTRSVRPLIKSLALRADSLEQEIIKRKALESELRESETRLQSLFKNIGEGIIVADPSEYFTYANCVAEAIFGVAPGQLIGRNFREFVTSAQYSLIRAETDNRRRGDKAQYEVDIKCDDGQTRSILLTATPELDASGNLVAEFGVIRDISARRESEAMLRRLNKAVEASSDVIFLTNREGVFIYANPAFERLYGYRVKDVIGKETPRILKSDKQGSEFYGHFWRSLLKGKRIQEEIVNKTATGHLLTIAVTVNAVKNEKGEIEAFLAVQKDITEQKLAEFQLMEYTQEVEALVGKEQELTAELKQSLEDLEASKTETEKALHELKIAQTAMVQSEKMASIGVLAAGVAHEINNPVGFVASNLRELQNYTSKIQSYLKSVNKLEQSLSMDDLESSRQLQKELEATRRQQKLDFILEDLTDLITDSLQGTSNIETIVHSLKLFSRKDDDALAPLNLKEIVENSIRVVNNQLKYHTQVTLEADDIPEVWGQIGGLQQVFSNLLINAAQAIEDNGKISIRISLEGDTAKIAIEDSGCGIAPENLDRIFEPFYTTKDVGKGTGLGLSIVFDIIKKHNGKITVQSEVGKGTTFTIHLPVVQNTDSVGLGEIS